MIEVDHLAKYYGSLKAVDDISFQVKKGEILGFLGPNGAGKTTTMKMLSCFLPPSYGTARINGKDIQTDSIAVREMIGYLPESAPSYKNMTVTEFLEFIVSTRKFNSQEKKERVNRIIDITSLNRVRRQTIDTLSKGYRQRVGFAQALIHDPPVLILDEPTDGLDPNQKKEVRNLIKNISSEKAIILSTHILEEMEAVCSRAIIINHGKIVADGAPAKLLENSSMFNVVSLILESKPEESVLESIRNLESVNDIYHSVVEDTEKYKIQVIPINKADILTDVKNFVDTTNLIVLEMYREKGYMDEVFHNLTLGGQS